MNVFLAILILHIILFTASLVFIWKQKIFLNWDKIKQTIFSALLPIGGPIVTLAILAGDELQPAKPTDRYMGQSIDESMMSGGIPQYPHL